MMEMEETPVCDAGATGKCLFCAVSLPPGFTIVNGKITRLKRETADHDGCLSNFGSLLSAEDSLLDKHLEVVFILRKILDIPEMKLHQFLNQFGGQLHPEFWVGVCSLCGEAVQQFYTTLKEISELKKRLTRISKQLKSRIYDTRELGGAEDGLTSIWEEIREEVLKDFQEVPSRVVDVVKRDPEEVSQQQDVDSEGCGNINSRKILPTRCSSKGSQSVSSRLSSYSEPEEEVDNDEEPTSDFEPDDHDSNWSNPSTDSEIVKKEPTKMPRKPGPKPKREPFITTIRHGNRIKYKCSLCSAVRSDRISLRSHLRSHQRRDGFSCTECGWLIHSRDKNRHYNHHHPGKKPPTHIFSCQKCPARYKRKAGLMNHAELHEESGNSEACLLCGWLVKIKLMPSHMKAHHPQEDELKEKPSHCPSTHHEKQIGNSLPVSKEKADPPNSVKIYRTYKCSKCPARSNENGFLKRHLRLHDPSNEEPCTTCELCGWVLKTKGLQRHLAGSLCPLIVEEQKQGDKDIAYSCDYCQMLFTEKWVFKRHFRRYHADQEFAACAQPNCQEKFESQQLLKFHMDEAHPDVQNLEENSESEEGAKCPHCELIFASKMKKDYHIAEKHRNILLTCTTCNITMKNYMCYRKHMEQTSIHATSPSIFCELCGISVWTNKQLLQHRRQQHFAELGLEPFKCQECGLILSTNDALKFHIKVVHAKGKNYSCEYCGQSCSTHTNLANHLRAYHEGPLATAGATDGKHFRLEKKGEDAEETWLCDFCPGTFPNLMGIRNHLLKIHYYELKYICEGCDKRFCAFLGLHTHRRRCEELKKKNKCGNEEELNGKFPCRFCPKHFFCARSLSKHERSLHKDRLSHRCQKCGKAFKVSGRLANHLNKCVLVPPSETAADVTQ